MNLVSALPTAALVIGISSLAASAATYSFTEGNGNNRPLVDGSQELEDAPQGVPGFNLNSETSTTTFTDDDEILIFGRIVGLQDLFTYTFAFDTAFTVSFNFGGYFVDSTEVADSGLVAQDSQSGGPAPGAFDTAGDSKGVEFGLLEKSDNSIVDMYFSTDVLSVADMGPDFSNPVIFTGEGGTSYSLIVDGSMGPNKNGAALYDLKIEGISPVPLPASAILLGTAFAAFGVAARRHRRRS
jgi:hypothetical protein